MQRSEKNRKRLLDGAFLCVLSGAVMVTLVVTMAGTAGCNAIFPPADPCESVVCFDENLCTTDACVEGECVYTDVVCSNGYECDEATGECVEVDPCEGITCDDQLLCTTDQCVDGECFYTAVECAEGETCDPDTGDCGVILCEEDADCADGEVCTDGQCVEGVGCTDDDDCDDGLYCNGVEICGVNGLCRDGEEPCGEDQTCVEGDNAAVCTDQVTDPHAFTLGQDSLSGTTGSDDFSAPLILDGASGTESASLQTGDAANGLAGDDTLTAVFLPTSTAAIVPQLLAGIETFYLTNSGSVTLTLQATNISGLETVYTKNSAGDISITGLTGLIDAGFIGMSNANDKLELDFVATATNGSSDALTCTLQDTTAGELELDTGAANGIESLTFHSTGDTVNRLSMLNQTDGTSLATVHVTGDIGFTLEAEADNTVRTFDASGMTVSSAGVTLGNGTTAVTYTAFNTVDIKSITGSSGDDTFIFGTTLDGSDADGAGEKIDGGAGDDVLQMTLTSALATAPPIDNIETLRVNATAAASFTLLNVPDVTAISVEADAAATALAVNNVPPISTRVWPTLQYRGDGSSTAQIYDTVTYTPYGATAATGDSLTVEVGNRGTVVNTVGAQNQHTISSLTLANIETLTLKVSDGPLTMSTGINGSSSTLISTTVTGSSNVALGRLTAAADTLTSIDATGVIGNFSAVIDCMNGGTVNLGSGNDSVDLTGSAASTTIIQSGAGNDTITGAGGIDNIAAGAGADTIYGVDGADVINGGDDADTINGGYGDDRITGGAGTDTLNGDGGADTISGGDDGDTVAGGAGADIINGEGGADTISGGDDADTLNGGDGIDNITTGTGADTIQFDVNNVDATDADAITDFTAGASGDVMALDISAVAGGIVSNLTEAVPVAIAAAADNKFIIDTAHTGYANIAAAETAINAVNANTDDFVIMFFNTTNSRLEVYVDADSGVGGSSILLCYFTNLNTAGLANTFMDAFVQGNYDTY